MRVRHAIGYAIDRQAIVEYLRRGLAAPATGMLPPFSWAYEPDVFTFTFQGGGGSPQGLGQGAQQTGVSGQNPFGGTSGVGGAQSGTGFFDVPDGIGTAKPGGLYA